MGRLVDTNMAQLPGLCLPTTKLVTQCRKSRVWWPSLEDRDETHGLAES